MNIRSKIFTIALLLGLNSCCDLTCERHQYAEIIIEKVETFEDENGRLPKDVSELGLTEMVNSPAFYQLTNDTTYMVWYGLGVGESKVYLSTTKNWTEEG